MKNLLLASVAVVGLVVAANPAYAGGLFGKGGLIRGTVGDILDTVVDKPLTPILQATVVIAGATAAATFIDPLAAPAGAALGEGINDAFAGGSANDQAPAAQQAQNVPMGTTCQSDVVGSFPMPNPQPIGQACKVQFQNGKTFDGKVGA